MSKISASEVIRRTALKILAQYPQGLQYGTLKEHTEQELKEIFEPDSYNKGKYRSALWNLDKVYSEYVYRPESPYRGVRFAPTELLISDSNQIEIPEKEILKSLFLTKSELAITFDEEPSQGVELSSQYRLSLITSKLQELVNYIKESGLYDSLELDLRDLEYYTKEEIDAMLRLKFQLDILVLYRNQLFMGVFKGGE